MDIELYNYTDIALNDYRSGKLHADVERMLKKPVKDGLEEDEDSTNDFNAGVSFLPMSAEPAHMSFKRDNADFMNNFFVDIVVRSFTNIEEIHRQARENNEHNNRL